MTNGIDARTNGIPSRTNAIEVHPYFAPGERYPSLIGVKAEGDEHEMAYIRKADMPKSCEQKRKDGECAWLRD